MPDEIEISVVELVRNFAKYRDQATISPVHLTHHGRRTHVIISDRQYQEILEEIESTHKTEASYSNDAGSLYSCTDWIGEGMILCGPNFEIRQANRVASSICLRSTTPIPQINIFDALPELSGSIMERQMRRTMHRGEPCTLDIPSPFAENSYLRFRCFPVDGGIGLTFRDISDEVHNERLADIKKTLVDAMDANGKIGYIRLSLRGTIDRVNAPICSTVDLSEDRLIGVTFSDLIEKSERPRFKEALEEVFREGGWRNETTAVLSNDGSIIRLEYTLVQLKGAYGTQGALMLVIPIPSDS